MPRIRQLKPSFFLDEDLAECSPWARLLFQGLWTLADSKGRLEDRPTWIRVQVFPYDHLETHRVSIDGLLSELANPRKSKPGSFISRYVVGGRGYIQIVNFLKHQKVHPKEPPSEIPDAPVVVSIAGKKHGKPGKNTAKRGEPGKETAGIPDSGFLVLGSGERNLGSGGVTVPVTAVPVSWTREAIDDHRELKGHMPPKSEGRIPAALKALVDEYGWPRVRPPWRAWLVSSDARYGVEWFAGNFLAVESGRSRASPEAKRRLDGMNAMIQGGLRGDDDERSSLDTWTEGSSSRLPGQGPRRLGTGGSG